MKGNCLVLHGTYTLLIVSVVVEHSSAARRLHRGRVILASAVIYRFDSLDYVRFMS